VTLPSGLVVVTDSASIAVTMWRSSGVTPMCSSARCALADRDGGKPVRTRSAPSISSTFPDRVSV